MNCSRAQLQRTLLVIHRLARAATKDVADGVACFRGLCAALLAIRREAASRLGQADGPADAGLDDPQDPAA